ncbi:hypothetical protein BZA77DRAFT_386674 [Pyronema omphalodes]|nr:hypothetical protein BZA77DRAFT_386674 [Pyronema omphalodes]
MSSLELIFGLHAFSVLPKDQVVEWLDQFRKLDLKHTEETKRLKAEISMIKEENIKLVTKVKALTEENEKLQTELAKDPVSVDNKMEVLLKGLETRLNETAEKRETALRESNITIEKSIKAIQDSVDCSARIARSKMEYLETTLKAIGCTQALSDSSSGFISSRLGFNRVYIGFTIIEVFIKKPKAGSDVAMPYIYMKKATVSADFSSLTYYIKIPLCSPTLVYIADKAAERTQFKLEEWSIYMEISRRIEIAWLDSEQVYEVAFFESASYD